MEWWVRQYVGAGLVPDNVSSPVKGEGKSPINRATTGSCRTVKEGIPSPLGPHRDCFGTVVPRNDSSIGGFAPKPQIKM